jgi:WD40 repeat protein
MWNPELESNGVSISIVVAGWFLPAQLESPADMIICLILGELIASTRQISMLSSYYSKASNCSGISCSSSGEQIAVTDGSRRTFLFRVGSRWEESREIPIADSFSLISRSGREVYSVGDDGLWKIYPQKQFLAQSRKTYSSSEVAISPDGGLVALPGAAGDCAIVDLDKKHRPESIPLGSSSPIEAIAFSGASPTLALVTKNRLHILTLNHDRKVISRTVSCSRVDRARGVTALTFSEDGKTIYTGGDDRTLKAWSLDGVLQKEQKNDLHGVPLKIVAPWDGRVITVTASRRKPDESTRYDQVVVYDSNLLQKANYPLVFRPVDASVAFAKRRLYVATETGYLIEYAF